MALSSGSLIAFQCAICEQRAENEATCKLYACLIVHVNAIPFYIHCITGLTYTGVIHTQHYICTCTSTVLVSMLNVSLCWCTYIGLCLGLVAWWYGGGARSNDANRTLDVLLEGRNQRLREAGLSVTFTMNCHVLFNILGCGQVQLHVHVLCNGHGYCPATDKFACTCSGTLYLLPTRIPYMTTYMPHTPLSDTKSALGWHPLPPHTHTHTHTHSHTHTHTLIYMHTHLSVLEYSLRWWVGNSRSGLPSEWRSSPASASCRGWAPLDACKMGAEE